MILQLSHDEFFLVDTVLREARDGDRRRTVEKGDIIVGAPETCHENEASLRAANALMLTSVSELRKDVTARRAAADRLNVENSALRDAVRCLTEKNEQLTAESAQLTKRNKQIESKNGDLSKENASLRSAAENLKLEVGSLKKALAVSRANTSENESSIFLGNKEEVTTEGEIVDVDLNSQAPYCESCASSTAGTVLDTVMEDVDKMVKQQTRLRGVLDKYSAVVPDDASVCATPPLEKCGSMNSDDASTQATYTSATTEDLNVPFVGNFLRGRDNLRDMNRGQSMDQFFARFKSTSPKDGPPSDMSVCTIFVSEKIKPQKSHDEGEIKHHEEKTEKTPLAENRNVRSSTNMSSPPLTPREMPLKTAVVLPEDDVSVMSSSTLFGPNRVDSKDTDDLLVRLNKATGTFPGPPGFRPPTDVSDEVSVCLG